ncbi:hypothetical protein KI688_004718 [Linnemannia hyalina]|uniref:Uncharacterized protein n=1 Tax=Linnemannia hyalina TaxID=64524 RepID=A0A9P7XN13_9FUNG|nr:hypothetical protein KI688_004718 [Linnemannia hyalina]
MDTLSVTPGTTTSPLTARKPAFRPLLQPRAAAALDFNDDSDDSDNDFLSADYKAQRKTTMDLVDFFKNAPPPPPAPSLPPVTVDDKKKRSLLQRLRNRKSGSMLNGGSNRASLSGMPGSVVAGGVGSTISTASGATATLPNGKKYVMIAVDYKDSPASTSTAATTTTPNMSHISPVTGITNALAATSPKRNSPTSSMRQSRVYSSGSDDGKPVTGSTLLGSNMQTTFDSSHLHSGLSTGGTGDTRRSIIIQAGGGEGSSFILDNSPFLLDNFALDTDFIMSSSLSAQGSKVSGVTTTGTSTMTDAGQQHRRTQSQRSGFSQTADGGMSRRGTNKVTFNIAGQQQGAGDEDPVSKALSQRIANHKAQLLKNQGFLGDDGADSANESGHESSTKPPEVTLPKPISRKKVRHVQIQTQHCIMRPMYTQTEPMESLVRDSEPREFSTQTSEGSCEMGTSTELDAAETASVATSTSTGTTMVSAHIMTAARATSKVASLVASLSHPTAPTNGTFPKGTATTAMSTTSTETLVPSAPLTAQEHEELLLLRQKNSSLQAQVITLQRDLASEMRARTRTAVAMQDTRDKFEMLSAIAYKKIKEMIFQRHVLEMEIRELRTQVDMHAAEDAAVSAAGTVEVVSPSYRQHHHPHHHHHQQHHSQQQSQQSQQQQQQQHYGQQHHGQHHHNQQHQQYVSVGHY